MVPFVFTSCGNSSALAKQLAQKLKAPYSPLTLSQFPDGDIYLKFNTSLKNKTLILVQSFQPHPQKSLFNIIFAAQTAKDLGAKKVILVAPYLSFMRQDKRFHPGESISSKVMAFLLNHSVDKLITIDPHLHRYRSLKEIFTIPAKKLSANSLIADYLKTHFRNEIIIGPDWESYQWAKEIARHLNVQASILKKTRFTSRKVKIKMLQPLSLKNKNVVIIDDIISTGHTLAETAKQAKKLGARSITAVCIHGLFVDNALKKLQAAGIKKIISTNTIEHPTNHIDITGLLVQELQNSI